MGDMVWPRVDGLRTLELGTPGRVRRELTALVLAGEKTATAGLLDAEYVAEGETLETVGERLFLIDDGGRPAAMIEITGVEVVPFADVTDEFAHAEGEGYADYADWARRHRRYWEGLGHTIDDATAVVCVWFRVLPD
ncbi:ASCH domain-containing protein [Micromonospora sp. NPDC049679]|uniref:ASCH domain-containing protein n=1 Tax=Micromonospora sp. NPDC049679 TaxID=3155920 RepID=UPI0033C773BF